MQNESDIELSFASFGINLHNKSNFRLGSFQQARYFTGNALKTAHLPVNEHHRNFPVSILNIVDVKLNQLEIEVRK